MIKQLVLPAYKFLDLRQSRRAETLLPIDTHLQAGLPWFPRFTPDNTPSQVDLVDFIELRLSMGEPLEKAVVDAGAVRFRPMMLTAATVVVESAVILFDRSFRDWPFRSWPVKSRRCC